MTGVGGGKRRPLRAARRAAGARMGALCLGRIEGGEVRPRGFLRRNGARAVALGRQLERLAEVRPGARKILLLLIGQAAAGEGRNVVVDDAQRRVEVGDGTVELVLVAPGLAAEGVIDRSVGRDRDRAVEIGQRAVQVPLEPPDLAAVAVGARNNAD